MVNLNPLKKATQTLNDMILEEGKTTIEYDVTDGKCFGWGLYKTKDIAIQRAFLTKGSVFEKHVHEKKIEIIIVYEGKAKVLLDDSERIIEVGDVVRIGKGIIHGLEILEDTWMIGITIPASGNYPDTNN